MIGLVPEEILNHILVYADPIWACSLGFTSRCFHHHISQFYQQNAATFLRSGGIWHNSIKSKRTRDSLLETQRISYAPMGLHSILHQQCVGCKKKYMASVHKDFGVIAHPVCIRQFLINIYYFEKFGLEKTHFHSIPYSELSGYSAGFYGRGAYSYIAVWKDSAHVPYEWTSHYLFHNLYQEHIHRFVAEKRRKEQEEAERKRALQEEKKRLKKEAFKQIRLMYQERMKTLMEDLEPTLSAKQVRNVLKTKLPEEFRSLFFQKKDVPPGFFTPEDYKEAAYVVSNIHRLMEHLTIQEISSLKYKDLGKSVGTLCREKVQFVLGGIVEKIHQKHIPSPFIKQFNKKRFPQRDGRPTNTRCMYRKCGVCCRGCLCHSRR